jgi:hypothetical protein
VCKEEKAHADAGFALCKKAAIPLLICIILSALLPDSKTAAAMYVIPAIANNETIKAESKEIYELAKEGLKKLVEEKK